jgi:transposase InsO family protein
MRREGIRSTRHRRFKVRTTDAAHDHPVAPNLLGRQFQRQGLDEAWVSDITYVPTGEGWLYVATVMDLCSRRIVGWATADHLRAELAAEGVGEGDRDAPPAGGPAAPQRSGRAVRLRRLPGGPGGARPELLDEPQRRLL